MNRKSIDELWKNDSHWRWGIVYCCREDPRVIVPRRWRWGGWTLNVCHPKAGIAGIAALALVTLPSVATVVLFDSPTLTLTVMALSIAAVIYWAHKESNRFS